MIPDRVRSIANTMLWVLGAVLMGAALNQSVVSGEHELFAPAIVAQFLVGGAMVVIGYAIRPQPRSQSSRSEAGGPATEAEEYDPSLSPLESADTDEPNRRG